MEKILIRTTWLVTVIIFITSVVLTVQMIWNSGPNENEFFGVIFLAIFIVPSLPFALFFITRWVLTGRAPWEPTPPKKIHQKTSVQGEI